MSNPFETPSGAFASSGIDARVNPFARQDAPRAQVTRAAEEEFSNPFESAGAGVGQGVSAFAEALPEVPMPEAPRAFAPASRVAASVPEPVNPGSTFGAYDVQAYAEPAAQPATGQSAFGKREAAPSGGFASSASAALKSAFGGFSGASSAPVMGGGEAMSAALAAQQRDLDRREAEILRRERDLELRERNGGGGDGGKSPNWPLKCYPVAYHNIGEEIPSHHARAVRMCYAAYCILALALLGNMFVATARLFTDGQFASFLMAFIYLVCGVPGAYTLWYKRLYNSCKRDRALGFMWFFLMFLLHIAFVVYASLAPPGFDKQEWSLCGVLNLDKALAKSKILGIFHAVVMSLFMVDAGLSLLSIRWVYISFRGGGHSVADIRSQAYAEGARSAMMSQSV